MVSLHQNIKKLSQSPGGLRLSALGPNSIAIARRMIGSGELIKKGESYVWHEQR